MKDFYIVEGGCGLVGVKFYTQVLCTNPDNLENELFDWACDEAGSYGDVIDDESLEDDEDFDGNETYDIIRMSDIWAKAELYDETKHGLTDGYDKPYKEIYAELKGWQGYDTPNDWYALAFDRLMIDLIAETGLTYYDVVSDVYYELRNRGLVDYDIEKIFLGYHVDR